MALNKQTKPWGASLTMMENETVVVGHIFGKNFIAHFSGELSHVLVFYASLVFEGPTIRVTSIGFFSTRNALFVCEETLRKNLDFAFHQTGEEKFSRRWGAERDNV